MPMHLITGHAETAHISAADAGALNAASIGPGSYVFDYGDNLAATMTTANRVTIGTGALMHQGRQALVDAPVELTVESGTQAQKRIDLVVARYTKSGDIDDMQLAVVKGTPVSYGEPSAPEIQEGSILEGATASDMPLWSIEIDGITPGDPVQLFETVPSIDALRDSVSQIYNLTPNCTYWKVFGTVFLSWQGVTGLRAGWNTIGTLPEGFRPTSGFADSEGTRVSGLIKMLGNAGADSTGTIDVYSSGLARVWFPRATNDLEPSSGQVFFRAD